MAQLNYLHLEHFLHVVEAGGLSAAARRLGLSHPTLSAQLKALEAALDAPLFDRKGRALTLTPAGRIAYDHAQRIFRIGAQLRHSVTAGSAGARPLRVGITDVLPKLAVHRLLAPILNLVPRPPLLCIEGNFAELQGQLARHELDCILADAPLPPDSAVRAYNHLLGESGISFFAARAHAEALRETFPRSLHEAPALLPIRGTVLRRELEDWFVRTGIEPVVVAEFEDSALLKVFGQDGLGFFAAATVIEGEIEAQYRVERIGRCPEVGERFYAISTERRLRHPGVRALTEQARGTMFAGQRGDPEARE